MLYPQRNAIELDAIGYIGAAVPAFQIKATIGAVAAVAIEAAEPSGQFIAHVKQAARVISKESLQCLRRGIHCNDARAQWLVGHFSIGRPFERRFFVFDGLTTWSRHTLSIALAASA